mmetsp:Transcript_39367/g.63455  ORF Transcript_39367/g.63455 Transcript_39367/m.63455 type:complete len:124 (+) Transcript_39367:3035-3406(+)
MSKNSIESSQHTYTHTHTHYHTHTITHIHWQRFGIVLGYQFLVQKCGRDSKIGSVSKETCVDRLLKLPGLVQKVQAIASGESSNLILQSQSNWSLFNGTWQKRHRELENRLSCEIGEMTLRMQ